MSEQGEGVVQSTGTAPRSDPVVRAITLTDVNEAWTQGIRDFRAAPAYGLVFGGLYAAGGIIIIACVTALGLGYLAYPLAAGFALIGPFAAVGLYEVSRRREAGMVLTWRAVLGSIFEQRNSQLAGWVSLRCCFSSSGCTKSTTRRPVSGDALVCHITCVPRCPDDDARGPCLPFPWECDRGAVINCAILDNLCIFPAAARPRS